MLCRSTYLDLTRIENFFFLCLLTCFSALPFSDRKNVVNEIILWDVAAGVAVLNSQTTHKETGRMFVCPQFDFARSLYLNGKKFFAGLVTSRC